MKVFPFIGRFSSGPFTSKGFHL